MLYSYGTNVPIAAHRLNPTKAALDRYHHKHRKVAISRTTNNFLHMSGQGETKNRHHAWVGFSYQFAAISKVENLSDVYELVPISPKAAGFDRNERYAQLRSKTNA